MSKEDASAFPTPPGNNAQNLNAPSLNGQAPRPGQTLKSQDYETGLRVPSTARGVRSVDKTGEMTGVIPVVGDSSNATTVGPVPEGAEPLIVEGTEAVVPEEPQLPVADLNPQATKIRQLDQPAAPIPPSATGLIPRQAPTRQAPPGSPMPPQGQFVPANRPMMPPMPPMSRVPGGRPMMSRVRPGMPIMQPMGGHPMGYAPGMPDSRMNGSGGPRPVAPYGMRPSSVLPYGGVPRPMSGSVRYVPASATMMPPGGVMLPSRRSRRETLEEVEARQLEALRQAELIKREAEIQALMDRSIQEDIDLSPEAFENIDWDDDEETFTERLIRKSGRWGESILMFGQALRWAGVVAVTVAVVVLLVWALDRSASIEQNSALGVGGSVNDQRQSLGKNDLPVENLIAQAEEKEETKELNPRAEEDNNSLGGQII